MKIGTIIFMILAVLCLVAIVFIAVKYHDAKDVIVKVPCYDRDGNKIIGVQCEKVKNKLNDLIGYPIIVLAVSILIIEILK